MCTYRQKNHFIILIVFEILKIKNPVFWLAKNIFGFANQTWKSTWEYNLRTKFLPDMCFQQNHKSHYVTWFRPKNLHINELFFLQNPKNPVFWLFMRSSWEVSKFKRSFKKVLWATLEEKKFTYWPTDILTVLKS